MSSIHDTFKKNGFCGPLDILTREEAEEALTEVMSELYPEPSSKEADVSGSVATPNRFKLHLVLPTLARIAHHPRLVQLVKDALGSKEILLWSSDINIKHPNSPGLFLAHQDSTYAGLEPANKALTAWIALSDPVGVACLSIPDPTC